MGSSVIVRIRSPTDWPADARSTRAATLRTKTTAPSTIADRAETTR